MIDITQFFKRLFCRHDWKPIAMTPSHDRPDEIVSKCRKCGKLKSEWM